MSLPPLSTPQAVKELRARHNRLHAEELAEAERVRQQRLAQERRRAEVDCREMAEGLW